MMNLNQWNPEHYQCNSLIQQSNSLDLINSAYAFHGNESILDVGCGDGKITSWLAGQLTSGSVKGIDKSTAMLQYAAQHHKSSNLGFIHCDVNSICFVEEFDLAVSFNCLHWVQNLNIACKKIFNALKPHGVFIGLVYPRCDALWIPAEKLADSPEFKCYFKDFKNPYAFITKNDYEEMFRKANFEQTNIKTLSNESKFNNKNDFIQYIAGWLPHVQAIPDNKQSEFLNQYYDLFINETGQSLNKPFKMNYKQYNILCRK